jgi:hypothetical protein
LSKQNSIEPPAVAVKTEVKTEVKKEVKTEVKNESVTSGHGGGKDVKPLLSSQTSFSNKLEATRNGYRDMLLQRLSEG